MNTIRETIRQINSNLSMLDKDAQLLAFVTPSGTNSQHVIIANLAIMYARAGEKTIIVDTDFSSDALPAVFGVKQGIGLSDYLDEN